MPISQPSEAMRAGRRALEDVEGVDLIGDFQWLEKCRGWLLHYRITINTSSEFVPQVTYWYLLIGENYPWSYIKLYPAKEGGITCTFPHQWHNDEGVEEYPFRSGFLCLDTNIYALGRHSFDRQPYSPHERLRWHMQRAVEWLKDAATNQMVQRGDYFELPQFPGASSNSMLVGFTEGATSLATWSAIDDQCGYVWLSECQSKPAIYVARTFQSVSGATLLESDWGSAISLFKRKERGIWIRLPSVPVISPWQAPSTWGDLDVACDNLGVSLLELIENCADAIRDGDRHFALLGFPIPQKVGGTPSHLHWQAIRLPVLSWHKKAHGFQATPQGFRQRDRSLTWTASNSIQWIMTENWHKDEISRRGKLPDDMIMKHILIIGAGAIGSVLSEMLVRNGVERLTIIDGDSLEVGNLSRHTLLMGDVKQKKAEALMVRLNVASPHADVHAIATNFPPEDEEDIERIQTADIIVDATAHDDLLPHLQSFPWNGHKVFFSFSLGAKAQKLYCYAVHDDTFPADDYRTQINPFIAADKDALEQSGEEMPMEGTGCWHKLFPARVDDVWLMTSAAVKFMEKMLTSPPTDPTLYVYEQTEDGNGMTGMRRVQP